MIKILLMEDDLDLCQSIQQALKKKDIPLTAAMMEKVL